MKSDLVATLPYIQSTIYNSVAYKAIQPGYRSNTYILTINGHDQFSAQAAATFIHHLQNENQQRLTIQVVKRANINNTTSLVSHMTIFDQVPSLLPTNPLISSMVHRDSSIHTEFVSSATKPVTPSSFFEALKSPFKHHWKAAAWKHFNSNKQIAAFTKPFLKSDLPPDV